jgi:signal transduction histidine kinase
MKKLIKILLLVFQDPKIIPDDPELNILYKKERQEAGIKGAKIGVLIACILIPLFLILDYLVKPHLFYTYLIIKLGVTLIGIIILVIIHKRWFFIPPFHLCAFFVIFLSASLVLQCILDEGPADPFYAGINLPLLGFGIFAPLSLLETFRVLSIGWLIYFIPNLFLVNNETLPAFISNNFFMISTMLIAFFASRLHLYYFNTHWYNRYQRTNYFINLAHEIKTPLTLILNFLKKDIKTRGSSKDLEIVDSNLNKLQRDILNFLDLEKLNQGRIFYDHSQTISFSEIVKHKAKMFNEIAKVHNITTSLHIQDSLFVNIDPLAIDRALNNLLDNAIRYNKVNGSITINLTSCTDQKVWLSIKDTGIGMAEDQLDHIFEPYYQISHKKRNIQGMGMGLSIVKNIIDDAGGILDVTSQLDKGSNFDIVLNSVQPEDELENYINHTFNSNIKLQSSPTLRSVDFDNNRSTILVVEDNVEMLSFIFDHLQNIYNVFTSVNGKDALKNLKNIPKPHVIISDIMMDEMDGHEFFETLSKLQDYQDIPFIFLTAKTKQSEKVKALSNGAIDYIYKPFSIEELMAKTEAIIRNHRIKTALYEKNKYASLGMLLGGISHEVLNPLHSVYAPLENIEKSINAFDIKQKKIVKHHINQVYDNLGRIEELVKSLKTLYYRGKFEIQDIDLEEIIRSIKNVLEPKFLDKITFRYHIEENFKLRGHYEALIQIMINLISNAVDAIENKGTIEIVAEMENSKSIIRVKDNGCGIPEEDLKNVFEPFYTRKEVGKGSGLGLFIVNELIRKLNWKINIQSEINMGTQITIIT